MPINRRFHTVVRGCADPPKQAPKSSHKKFYWLPRSQGTSHIIGEAVSGFDKQGWLKSLPGASKVAMKLFQSLPWSKSLCIMPKIYSTRPGPEHWPPPLSPCCVNFPISLADCQFCFRITVESIFDSLIFPPSSNAFHRFSEGCWSEPSSQCPSKASIRAP